MKAKLKLKWSRVHYLTPEGISEIKKDIPGVYRLSHYNQETDKRPIHYVGQTKNLVDRLLDHLPESEENSCCREKLSNYQCSFRVAIVTTEADRDAVERALYDHFQPECNDPDMIPNVEPADINFE